METLARRRLTGVAGALLLLVSLVSIVALPALAHTASVSPSCVSLTVNLTYYNGSHDNSLKVTIDGVVVENLSDFGTSHHEVYPWSSSANHTYSVVVIAWDDPTGSKGWSKSWSGSWQACNPPTTTTTAPPTTTTTAAADDYYDGCADDYDHGSADDHDRCADHYDHGSGHHDHGCRRRLLRRLRLLLRPRFSSRLLRPLRRLLRLPGRSPRLRGGRPPRRPLKHRRPQLLPPPRQLRVWVSPGSRCRPRLPHR